MQIILYTNGIILKYTLTREVDIPAGVGHWSRNGDKIIYRDGEFKTEVSLAEVEEITDESQSPHVNVPLPPDTEGLYAILKPKRFLFTGSASTPTTPADMFIPTPRLKIKQGFADTREVLQVLWDTDNTTFLDYQPEIWLFTYKPTYLRRRKPNPSAPSAPQNLGKKWVHPTHLDGSKHAGEAKYAGRAETNIGVFFPRIPIQSTLSYFYRPSEFTLPTKDTWQTINIEPDKYFWAREFPTGEIKILQEIYDNGNTTQFILGVLNGSEIYNIDINRKKYRRRFRFVIAIKKDNEYYFSDASEEFYIERHYDKTDVSNLTLKLV